MLFKQTAINLLEYWMPIFTIKPSLDEVRGKFWDIRKKFLDEEKIEQIIRKEGRLGLDNAAQLDGRVKPMDTRYMRADSLVKGNNDGPMQFSPQAQWKLMKVDEAKEEL
jgi:hypothetical protein